MTDPKIIQLLFDTGHVNHPFGKRLAQNGTWCRKADLPRLTLSSDQVTRAVESWQDFMAPTIEPLAMAHHGRIAMADGELGPAGREVMAMDRCGYPDYTGDAHAMPSVGSGNWKRCYDIGEFHCAKVKVHKKNMPSFLGPVFEEAWDRVVAAYEQIGLRFLRTDDRANIEFSFFTERKNYIGLAIVGQGQSCSGNIWCRYSSRYHPSNVLGNWTSLMMHELGHNVGLGHVRSGIMAPVLSSGLAPTWKGDSSLSSLKRRYGGEPVPSDDDEKQIIWDEQGLRSTTTGDVVWAKLPVPIPKTKRAAMGMLG